LEVGANGLNRRVGALGKVVHFRRVAGEVEERDFVERGIIEDNLRGVFVGDVLFAENEFPIALADRPLVVEAPEEGAFSVDDGLVVIERFDVSAATWESSGASAHVATESKP
jgi:hypothetical protein